MSESHQQIEAWIKNHCHVRGRLPIFIEELQAFLTPEQTAKVLNVYDNICTACWDNYKGCHCWNDE